MCHLRRRGQQDLVIQDKLEYHPQQSMLVRKRLRHSSSAAQSASQLAAMALEASLAGRRGSCAAERHS
jgi:hypothetical protein